LIDSNRRGTSELLAAVREGEEPLIGLRREGEDHVLGRLVRGHLLEVVRCAQHGQVTQRRGAVAVAVAVAVRGRTVVEESHRLQPVLRLGRELVGDRRPDHARADDQGGLACQALDPRLAPRHRKRAAGAQEQEHGEEPGAADHGSHFAAAPEDHVEREDGHRRHRDRPEHRREGPQRDANPAPVDAAHMQHRRHEHGEREQRGVLAVPEAARAG
jgi:hypothetical protein